MVKPINARKVLEMGGGTFLVSIPKQWAKKNGVTKGSTLAVEELSGTKLMVRPIEHRGEEQRKMVVDYDAGDIAQVLNDVTGAYLLGYDEISIESRKVIPREERSSLKSTVGRLVGLEIMDEDSKRMSLQFLMEPTAIVPEKIVRRISGLLDGMLKDTSEALVRGDSKLLTMVAERDDDVDRLYFLLVRATRAAVVRPEVAEEYGLSPVDLLDYRVLASFLESVGDSVTDLSRKLHGGKGSKRLTRVYIECVQRLKAMNELAARSFISRKSGKTQAANSEMRSLAAEVAQRLVVVGQMPSGEGSLAAETMATLDRIGRLYVDISDLSSVARPDS